MLQLIRVICVCGCPAEWLYLVNSFRGLGEVASTPAVQLLSTPWIAAAHLAVTESIQPLTYLQMLAALGAFPLSLIFLVKVDRWSYHQEHMREVSRLSLSQYQTREAHLQIYKGKEPNQLQNLIECCASGMTRDVLTLACRKAIGIRDHRFNITISMLLPVVLCLAPLFMGRMEEQWFYVVAGTALCMVLLAAPGVKDRLSPGSEKQAVTPFPFSEATFHGSWPTDSADHDHMGVSINHSWHCCSCTSPRLGAIDSLGRDAVCAGNRHLCN